MKESKSIQEIFQALRKRLLLIFTITIGLIVAVGLISYFLLSPKYQASSQFIVIQKQNENIPFNLNELETNVGLINTYNEIIRSPFILGRVIDELNLTIIPEELKKDIDVSSGENSQVVTVSAVAESPEAATMLANTVVEQFQITIPTIMSIDNVQILSKAKVALSREPIYPKPILYMFIAGLIGLSTGIGLSLIIEFLDTKVKNEQDIQQLGIHVLGVIPKLKEKSSEAKANKVILDRGETFEA